MNFTEQLHTKFGGFICIFVVPLHDQYVVIYMDVIVYLGRQWGEGALEQRSTFHAHILHREQRGANFLLHECSELQRID